MSRLLFTVYDNKTDFPVIVDGTAKECASVMGINIQSFYDASSGKNNRWVVLKRRTRGGPYGKKGISGKMSD